MSEANTEPLLLHAEVRFKEQVHHIPRRVQCQAVRRQTTERNVCVACIHHDLVIDAARCLLQVKVQEGELDDEASGGLRGPRTGLRIGVFLGVAGRRDFPLGIRQQLVTVGGGAAQH